MKPKKFVLPVVMGASLLTLSCGEKKKPADDSSTSEEKTALAATENAAKAAAPAAENMADKIKEVVAPASADQLAGQLGFASHLPHDTEGILSIYKLGDSFDRLLKTKIGKLILELAKEAGEDIRAELEGQEAQMARAVIGEEMFVSFGAGSGDQLAHLVAISRLSNYNNGKMFVDMASAAIMGKDPTDSLEGMGAQEFAMLAGILKDPVKAMDLLEKAELPPITVGIKVSNADMRKGFAAMVAGQFAKALNEENAPFEEVKVEKHGVQFTGFKISGKKIAATVDAKSRRRGEKVLGSAENVERFLKAVEAKDIVIATGVKDDYILVYAGASLDGFQLVDKPADSVLSHPEMNFMGNYTNKDIRLFTFAPKVALQSAAKEPEALASMILGAKDGLAGSDAFGDTRDIQRLLEHAAKLDRELLGQYEYERYGAVGFLEDGFKVESHGGSNQISIDFTKNHEFASVTELEGVALFMDGAGNEQFTAMAAEWIKTLGEAAYLMARRVSELDIAGSDFREFKEQFGRIDSMFSKDLLEIWKALGEDLSAGLGNEGAIIVDLRGSMPTVPVVPNSIVKNGLIPRIAYAATVKDRAKVGQSWDRLNGTLGTILEKSQKLGAPPIPMPAAFSSESDGLTSYFFTIIPFTTPNAMPSTSVSDDYFFISTSPQFAGELAKAAKSGLVKRKGSFAKLDFEAIHSCASDWLELVKNNQDEIFEGNEFAKDDFVENLPIFMRILKAAEELEDITFHIHKANDENRGSFHFNMK